MTKFPDLPRFLTIAEASRLSGVGESVIRSAITRGELPVFQPRRSRGGIRYLAEDDLREWMRSSPEVDKHLDAGAEK